MSTVRECPHCGAHVLSEGNFCPRCGHQLNADPTPVAAHPSTDALPPTLPEDDRPVATADAEDMGAAGDELQPVQIPDIDEALAAPADADVSPEENIAAPDFNAETRAAAPEWDTTDPDEGGDAVADDDAVADSMDGGMLQAIVVPDALDEIDAADEAEQTASPDDDAAGPDKSEDRAVPEDRADLPTTRLGTVEPSSETSVAAWGVPDAPPDTSTPAAIIDTEGGKQQDETGEYSTGDWSESAEAEPEIVERPAEQETLPETPVPDVTPPGEDAAHEPKPHPWLAELDEADETHPRLDERPPDMADTMPRLTGDLLQPTNAFATDWQDEPEPVPADVTSPVLAQGAAAPAAASAIPPAPFTPPPMPDTAAPAFIAPPAPYAPAPYTAAPYAPGYAPSPAMAFMQQRDQLYQRDGYHLLSHAPHEVVLARGKRLGVAGWLVALVSISGALWYFLILLLSGFQRDRVYITLEGDGYVYEDGPGAAHVRRQRARGGRRWRLIGLILFVLSFVLAAGLAIAAAITVSQDRYQAALREAYPAYTLFEERFTAGDADQADVDLMHDGLVAWSIAAVIAGVGLWGGLTLFFVGHIHATAYRVDVPALPGTS
ncbi:hypothetical protein [Aggregatilinea lenta]|uniref:hypothetical protein n=1 Tax=Aggregatilinea lenta TaxID=913108 RepID=UPI000E5A22F6|nr:hypothetical protein [Aggregatilinea lenta]